MNHDEAVERAAAAMFNVDPWAWHERAEAGLDASGYPAALEAAEQRAERLAAAAETARKVLSKARVLGDRSPYRAHGILTAALADWERTPKGTP